MKKRLFYTFIFLGIAAQFYVLVHSIVLRELTLRRGTVHRFQTAPVDPFDAFRGQYVALDFNALSSGHLFDTSIPHGKWCYLHIGTDTNGFAVVERVSLKPDVSLPHLKVRVDSSSAERRMEEDAEGKTKWIDTGKYRVHCQLPFDRYYMPEHLAPQAEEAYRQANRSRARDAAAVVRIWKGKAVIEDLEIDGIPIREVLKGTPK
ncbi:MAG: GDYXXLXY domain-containing protein [Kiritimatiellaeota bacterium]|nr:GDYXXLXY domain-containing protein [Kiritimatiellota bacterium]